MLRATVLLAGFVDHEASTATRSLLAAGACVLAAPDLASALEHLDGGMVDLILAKSGEAADHLRRSGSKTMLIVVDSPMSLDAAALKRLVQASRPL